MDNLSNLSITVLEFIMTDCLMRMEGSADVKYIEKQVDLFKNAENEVLSRGLRPRSGI